MSTISLLAVLIVAILAIVIVATSFPSFLVSRRDTNQPAATTVQLRANETSVMMSLRGIYGAEATYFAGDGQGSYGTLTTLNSKGLIDQRFTGTPMLNGYQFELVLDSPGNRGFCATARPLADKSGNYSYAISQQGVIYQLAGDTPPACDASTGLISTGTFLGS